MPRSRRDFRRALHEGLRENETYYRAALAALHPQHARQLERLAARTVADLLLDAVYAGDAVITDEPPDSRVLVADAGLLTLGATFALLDGPLPIGDLIAAGIIIIGGTYLMVQHASGSSRSLTRAEETAIVDELVDRSCSARTPQAALNCALFFHYTTPSRFQQFMRDNVIAANPSTGIVYVTWIPLSPEDVRTTLVFGRSNQVGDYVIAFSKKPDVTFFPGESFNELKHQGSLRFGRHINVVYAGPNVLP